MLRNNANYKITKQDITKANTFSLACPDQAYSVRELLYRNAQGMTLTIKEPQYSDSEDFEDSDITKKPDFDLTDIRTKYEMFPLGKKPYKTPTTHKPKEASDTTAENEGSDARNDASDLTN